MEAASAKRESTAGPVGCTGDPEIDWTVQRMAMPAGSNEGKMVGLVPRNEAPTAAAALMFGGDQAAPACWNSRSTSSRLQQPGGCNCWYEPVFE